MKEEKYNQEEFLKDLKSYTKNARPLERGYKDDIPKTISEKKDKISEGEKAGKRGGNSVMSIEEYRIDRLYEGFQNLESRAEIRTYYEDYAGMSKEAIRGYIRGVKEASIERSQDNEKGPPIIHPIQRNSYLAAKAGILHKPYVMKDIRQSLDALKEDGKEEWVKAASVYIENVFEEYRETGTVKADNSRGMKPSK